MNNKISLGFSIGLMFLVSVVSGQLAGVENQIEGAVSNLEKNITKVKEFTEASKWDFIGSQWKEFLLKNKAIAGVDAFFIKVNIVFVVLFAHDWAISLEMLFVFLLWIFTAISLYGYANCFLIKSGVQGFLIALGLTIVLAQARLFYYISQSLIKIILYKPSPWWKSLIFLCVIISLVVYLFVNKTISKNLIKARGKRDKELLEEKVKKTEKFQENIVKVAKQVNS